MNFDLLLIRWSAPHVQLLSSSCRISCPKSTFKSHLCESCQHSKCVNLMIQTTKLTRPPVVSILCETSSFHQQTIATMVRRIHLHSRRSPWEDEKHVSESRFCWVASDFSITTSNNFALHTCWSQDTEDWCTMRKLTPDVFVSSSQSSVQENRLCGIEVEQS